MKSKNYSKTISTLIVELQEFIQKYGDMPVAVMGHEFMTTAIYIDSEPYYYDGGVLYPIENNDGYHISKWKRSKDNLSEFGKSYLKIRCDEPEAGADTIDNEVYMPNWFKEFLIEKEKK